MFIHALTIGGAQSRTLALANGLAARGHQVDLIVAARGAAGETRLDPRVRLVPLSPRPPETVGSGLRRIADLMTSIPALARYLNSAGPDILLSMANHVAPIAALGHALMRRPKSTLLVLRASNHVTRTPSAHGNALRRLHLQPFWTQADHIIAVSGSVADSLIVGLGIAPSRITVLPSPILPDDLAARAAQTPEHDWLRAPDPARPTLLGIGRFVPQKGFDLLLDAFDQLRRRRSARLLLLGEGPQRPLLEEKVRQLGLEDLVSLPGITRNPFAALSHADLFVLPSRWEGLPATLIEALACGCPVVAADCPGGVREVLQDGRIGRLAPPGDAGLLAAAMDEALSQKPDRTVLQNAIQPYRSAAAIAAYEAWLLACLAGRDMARTPLKTGTYGS
ncbi:glycosyltransferase [Pedomonas mirosovicensis]|uniref:glycosyltransferase n=1 Tax=Pedomonas mirosovicensis TaxID=2908641 RepID=UPI00216935AD|nr:glycosyltransferase [Pedomonas mirosovicensis]MCH8686354.1 glycosyltransferase [Pedomonas mirosovicensis]